MKKQIILKKKKIETLETPTETERPMTTEEEKKEENKEPEVKDLSKTEEKIEENIHIPKDETKKNYKTRNKRI